MYNKIINKKEVIKNEYYINELVEQARTYFFDNKTTLNLIKLRKEKNILMTLQDFLIWQILLYLPIIGLKIFEKFL